MKERKQTSIRLSQCAVIIFAVLLAAMDVSLACDGVELSPLLRREQYLWVLAAAYLCSVAGWGTLFQLWQVLGRIRRERVFVPENVTALGWVSGFCFGVMGICLAAVVLVHPSLSLVGLAAGFMGLIVRMVKNAFQQAIAMKDELDFTV